MEKRLRILLSSLSLFQENTATIQELSIFLAHTLCGYTENAIFLTVKVSSIPWN